MIVTINMGSSELVGAKMVIADLEQREREQDADGTRERPGRVNRSSPADDFPGTERFQVVRRLGQGAAGTVYLVNDLERNAKRALKTLRQPSPDTILMLKNEFREVEALRHPNLAHLDELFEQDGLWFFTMEFVDGLTFLDYFRDNESTERAPDLGLTSTLFGQLAHGLCALHRANKIHCDIKPSNVLVDKNGRVVILDFGITGDARKLAEADLGIFGTSHYMAPEQALSEGVTPSADWYAFGVMLFQALTGRFPFEGSPHQVLMQKTMEEAPPPKQFNRNLPEALNQLCVGLLKMEPGERPSPSEILATLAFQEQMRAANAEGQDSVFVGRGEELGTLRQALSDVQSGRPVSVFVYGESGVGKSFLIRQFLNDLGPTVRVFRGRCYERESLPYKALDAVVDQVAEYLKELPTSVVEELLPPDASLLRRLFRVLEGVPSIAELAPAEFEESANRQKLRLRMFHALRELFRRITSRAPTIIVIDDLQWADADSWALLEALTSPPEPPPFLLLCTRRLSTESGPTTALDEAVLQGDVRSLHLHSLSSDDAIELAGRLSGKDNLAELRAIAKEARGHPMFIDELVRRQTAAQGSTGSIRLDDALLQRVEQLGAGARHLLELLTVAGRPLPQSVLADAAAVEFGLFTELAAELRAANFARSFGTQRDALMEPYHDRVRESVLNTIAPAAAEAWHSRLAVTFERIKGTDPEVLLSHWLGAGKLERAAEYAIQAAKNASVALAFDHAVTLYRRALELTAEGKDTGAIRLALADALATSGRGADAANLRLELAETVPEARGFELRRQAAEEFLGCGYFDEGVAVLLDVLESVGETYPGGQRSAVLSLLYHRFRLEMRGYAFERRDETAIQPETLRRIDALYSASMGLSFIEPVIAQALMERALRAALEAGEVGRIAPIMSLYICRLAAGGGAKAKQSARLIGCLERLISTMDPSQRVWLLSVQGFQNYFSGQWESARSTLETVATQVEHVAGKTVGLNAMRLLIARAEMYCGDLDSFSRRAAAYMQEADDHNDRFLSISVRGTCGALALLGSGREGDAEQELDKAEALLPREGCSNLRLYCQVGRVCTALYRGDPSTVHAQWDELWPLLDQAMLLRVEYTSVLAHEHRARSALGCLTARPNGSNPRLTEMVRDAIRTLSKTQAPYALALAGLLSAGLKYCANDRDAALSDLRTAVSRLDALDMGLYAAAARRACGVLSGGDSGAEQIRQAEAFMREQGVAHPALFARVFVPGLPQDL